MKDKNIYIIASTFYSELSDKLIEGAKTELLSQDKFDPNETTVGSANGTFTLKQSLDDGFNKGYELSNKITGKKNIRKLFFIFIIQF